MTRRPIRISSRKVSHKGNSFGTVLRGLQLRWTVLLTMFMLGLGILGDMMIRQTVEQLVLKQQISSAREQCSALTGTDNVRNLLKEGMKPDLTSIAQKHESENNILYVEFFHEAKFKLTTHKHYKLETLPIGHQEGSIHTLISLADNPKLYAQTRHTPTYLDVVHTVMAPSAGRADRQEVVGYVRIGVDLTEAQEGLATFFQNLRYAGIITILLMIPLAFMIVRRVAAPVNELGRVVNQLADGDFRVRAHIKRTDEIGQLAKSFNTMADQLSSSNDRLVRLNAELEDRVLQRTRQLKDLAARDPLTGLYNRRHLSEFLARRFAEAERYGTDLSCLMIDMDDFKQVNDKYGHEMGDSLLILTASVISAELRESDMAARFGGDEFCVLLPQTPADQAQKLAARIVQKFQQAIDKETPEKLQRCGMSVGIAGMQELHLVHQDELVKAADQALYSAKENGKNHVRLAETLA